MNKRDFIKATAILTGGAIIIPEWACKSPNIVKSMDLIRKDPFALPILPYAYEALEPNIDTLTMQIHHDKHHAAYITKLNDSLKGSAYETATLEKIFVNLNKTDNAAIRNNAGGHYNHKMFWESLHPNGTKLTDEGLINAINKAFGSFDKFKEQFSASAKTVFGSGWTWLCMDKNKQLYITNTPNQDNPLMTNFATNPGIPLLGLDVWEHAYYLKYQNKRADYINGFFNIVHWEKVGQRFEG
jgi:superoxide dismutase, Fe-Mn family